MTHPVCRAPHPALRAAAQPVDAFADDLRQLARDLIETMHAHDGIGLAAPQVGRSAQVFVVNPSRRRGGELVVVNPVLRGARGRASVVEGCLSLPDVWGRVRRAAAVRLEGRDVDGQPLVVEAEGLLAIVLQHEFDHLQGRLFIDRLPWLKRLRAQARLRAAACA